MTKHRLDALTDGIFAVAMTLLVIELRLPESLSRANSSEFAQALAHLSPRFIGWIISFGVLSLFWWGQTRAFHYVKHVDGGLVTRNLLLLAFASLLPFASAVSGAFALLLGAQIVYSTVMVLLSISALLVWRYLWRHPELCEPPMPTSAYLEARFRMGALIVISLVAIAIAAVLPSGGNIAFMLMMPAGRIGRRIHARASA